MAEKLSIRERIERRAMLIGAAVTGVSAVERWDARGNRVDHGSLLIVPGDERSDEDGMGDGGATTMNVLDLMVEFCLAQGHSVSEDSESDDAGTSGVLNRYLARLEEAFCAEGAFVEEEPLETAGEDLVIEVRKTGSSQPPREGNQGEAFWQLFLEVKYRTWRENPYGSPQCSELTV